MLINATGMVVIHTCRDTCIFFTDISIIVHSGTNIRFLNF